jgi:uncharacterized membrane protein
MGRVAGLGVFVSLLVLGCGQKQDPFGPDGGIVETVTYTAQVKPLLDGHCIRCHATTKQGASRSGAPIGLDYNTYSVASANAQRANQQIQAGSMPPGGPALASNDKAIFQAWLDQGLLE